MQQNKIVFVQSGRLGNAFFRYMACAIINIKNPRLTFCLKENFNEPEERFTYYAGLDYEGNDLGIEFSPNIQSMVMANTSAMGYNTLGYLKHTIDLDNLTSNYYINKENGNGLYVKKCITINDANFLDFVNKKLECFNVVMDGFFQFGHLYLHYKPQILKYMEQHSLNHSIQTDLLDKIMIQELLIDKVLLPEKIYDIVIHIRLGDFNGRPDYIELKYYFALFKTINFSGKKICILFEPTTKQSDHIYIEECRQWFQDKGLFIALETNSLMLDFNIMKQAKILVCSMSTLSWTAAYLSKKIEQCYMPNYNFYKTEERAAFYFHKPIENTILYQVQTTNLSSIKSIILTLPEYAETRLNKLDDFRQKLSQIGLETEIYNGVNGKDIIISKSISNSDSNSNSEKIITYQNCTLTYNPKVRINGAPMTKGEFGCAWSHLNLFKQLLSEGTDVTYYLILEDDIELCRPLNELYELLQHIPSDTDLCHLAKSDWYPFQKTKQVNAFFSECEKRFFSKTTAYLVSKKGAEKLLSYYQDAINVPIDDLINMIYRLTPDFRVYVPLSDYFFKEQDNVLSSIHEINLNT